MGEKYKTEEERKEARRLSIKKYNTSVSEKKKKDYQKNKELYHEKNKKYYEENKDIIKERVKKYREENKDVIKEKKKKHYQKNKEEYSKKSKKYYEENKESKKEYDKRYREENKEKMRIKRREYKKKRLLNDPLFKLKESIRRNISDTFRRKNYTKKSKTYEILGCTFEEFKKHIESQFEDWMTWDNYGNPYDGILEENKTWDIDHIIQLSSAETEEDVIILNHYTNLQPLCSYHNRIIKK